MDQIVNNIQLTRNLTCVNNIKKNMQSNDYIFKICNLVNFFNKICSNFRLKPNFVTQNNYIFSCTT